ncbi:MAG: glycoside hydrolase family 127 protein, partial [Armatimonadetes bacterium]|nr:glycoside hydrolase family 127 protein [Armatimonadota bacterium]
GRVLLTLESAGSYGVNIRIPGWCEGATISVNGKPRKFEVVKGYAELGGPWKAGDTVELNMPMPVRRVAAHPLVKADIGRLAMARGPLVYCVETVDQKVPITDLWLPADQELTSKWQPKLLGGVMTVTGKVRRSNSVWEGGLYGSSISTEVVSMVAIPYYAWDNREAGAMAVWLPTAPAVPRVIGLEGKAKVSMSFVSDICTPSAVNDGYVPAKSSETPAANCHFWPHKGGTEWVQYDFPKTVSVSSAQLFWFDDTGHGECRLPLSWRLLYNSSTGWKEVTLNSKGYPVGLDKWCEVEFAPITTKALRLEIKMQDGWSAGIHEWRVGAAE